MKKQLGQTDIFFPVPAALVVSSDGTQTDVLTVAWVGMVSSTPPTIGISLDKTRYSLELIRRSGAFTVNIPSAGQFKETDYCGLVSGKNRNKFEDVGFTPMDSYACNVPIIKECPFNLECRVTRELELGDYILILGEIVETHVDTDKLDMSFKTPKIDIQKVNPLVYFATVREYWALGQRLGAAFNAGKEIYNKVKGDAI